MPVIKGNVAKKNTEELLQTVVEAMQDKKANNVLALKFTPEITDICEYFVICDAENKIQARAISDNVEYQVKKQLGILPTHIEGYENSEWILLDYWDVVVHIFLKEKREFYALEKLWADAQFIYFSDEQTSVNSSETQQISHL